MTSRRPRRRRRLAPSIAIAALLLSVLAAAAHSVPLPVLGPEIQVDAGGAAGVRAVPKVAVFPDGGFVVVWMSGPKTASGPLPALHARVFGANGAPTTGELALPGQLTGSPLLDGVAALDDGRFVVLWDQNILSSTTGLFSRVMMQAFDRGGAPVTRAVPVHGRSLDSRYNGTLAVGAQGQIAVLWSGDFTAPSRGDDRTDMFGRFFSSGLAPRGGEMTLVRGGAVLGPEDGELFTPDAAAFLVDGSLVVMETDWGDDVSVTLDRVNSDGSRQAVDALAPGIDTVPSYDAGIAVAPGGSFAAVWDQHRPDGASQLPSPLVPAFGIEGRAFGADAKAFGAAVQPVSRRPFGTLVSPQIAALPDDSFVSIWVDESGRDGDSSGIFGRLLAADGTPVWRDFQVNVGAVGAQDSPALAGGRNGAVAVWVSETTTHIYARRITDAP